MKNDYILRDEDIILTILYGLKAYPERFRLVKVYDKENDKTLYLLTNKSSWTADPISQLFKATWDVGSCLFSKRSISFLKQSSILSVFILDRSLGREK